MNHPHEVQPILVQTTPSPDSMNSIRFAAGLFAGVLLLASSSFATDTELPLLKGLGDYSRSIETDSSKAQDYFNQGMRLLFGFNHGLSIRSFEEAARLDPDCAMAHWGIALACGPHINAPAVPTERAEKAWQALTLAQQHAANTSPVHRALIEALAKRYADPQPEDRKPLDVAYADAMREVWKAYPKDADVGVLFAEAMMNLRPWDQWTPEGQPQPGTEEVIATLDAVIQLNDRHPFANHLYIHAVEASPNPERALAAADRLRNLQPALAHNVHMPSHIDIRVGNWHKAVESNLRAIDADQARRRKFGAPKDMIVIYAAHNRHMLAFAAMMTGQSELAIEHIEAMVDEMPEDFLREWAPFAEGFAAMPYEVLVRFGRWDAVLAKPDNYPDYMPFTKSIRLAARAIAYAAKGDTAAAREEQAKYVEQMKQVPKETILGNNPADLIFAVATPMVEGEILVREGKLDEGFAALREAVAAEDKLHYDEPPGWILPVRHALGANLMAHGRHAEAEQVYREDLARLPNNGWSLFGLAEALMLQGKHTEAATVLPKFRDTWSKADLTITSSCFCQPGPIAREPRLTLR